MASPELEKRLTAEPNPFMNLTSPVSEPGPADPDNPFMIQPTGEKLVDMFTADNPFMGADPDNPFMTTENEEDGRIEILKGFEAGLIGGNSRNFGLAAEAAGHITGIRSLVDMGLEIAEFGEDELSELRPDVPSIRNVRTDSLVNFLEDATDFATFQIGMGVGTMAPNLVLGGAAGLASANPVIGAAIGASGPSYIQNFGDVFGSIKEDAAEKITSGELSLDTTATVAAFVAVPMAALDVFGIGKLLSSAAAPVKQEMKNALVTRLLTEAGKGASFEGLTEAMQEVISQFAQTRLSDKDLLVFDRIMDVVDSFAGGALTGGAVSAGGAFVTGPRAIARKEDGTPKQPLATKGTDPITLSEQEPVIGEVDIERGRETLRDIGTTNELVEPRIETGLSDNVISSATEMLLDTGVALSPDRLISDQFAEMVQTGRLTSAAFQEILDKHNVKVEDFAEMWRADVRMSAKQLAELSVAARALDKLAKGEDIPTTGLDANARGAGFWRRLDNIRRGLMVTQLATAMRNAETQVGRIGLDVLQRNMDEGLVRLFNPSRQNETHPIDNFSTVLNLFSRNKELVDEILSVFPKEQDALFLRYSSDIERAGSGILGGAEKVVDVLNTINRFQEFTIRRAVFAASLQRRIRNDEALKGQTLEQIVKENKVGRIPRRIIEDSVNDALEITWARNFDPQAAGAEGLAGAAIQLVNKLPGIATVPFPFPRFLMNAIKFQYEFSPLGYLGLLSDKEAAAIADGNMQAISRATLGSGMLLVASALRNSDLAGDRWYEINVLPDSSFASMCEDKSKGCVWDTRAFNPFASYMFVAEVVKRMNAGTLDDFAARDIVQGILASNLRAGAGMFMMDNILESWFGSNVDDLDKEKAARQILNTVGEVVGGSTIPLAQVRDFVAGFDETQAIVRDSESKTFLGPFLRNIPFAQEALEEVEVPTRSKNITRQSPVFRQLTGITLKEPRTPIEKMTVDFGFRRSDIMGSTGDPDGNRLVAKHMGPLVDTFGNKFIRDPSFRQLGREGQKTLLREMFGELRAEAFARAEIEALQGNDDVLAAKIRRSKPSKRERRFFQELIGRPLKPGIDF